MTQGRATLTELEMHGDFIRRHIGPSDADVEQMLAELGCTSVDDLINQVVPADIVSERALELGAPRSERATSTYLRNMRHRNQVFVSMIGCGYHGTVMPPVIRRNVFENPDWYTAYTPYQAEVSQGRLEVLLSFQQMIGDLTGMETRQCIAAGRGHGCGRSDEYVPASFQVQIKRVLCRPSGASPDPGGHQNPSGIYGIRDPCGRSGKGAGSP